MCVCVCRFFFASSFFFSYWYDNQCLCEFILSILSGHTRCYIFWENSAELSPCTAVQFGDCNNMRASFLESKMYLVVFSFCVDKMAWFACTDMVWFGEAKIYVLMSFPDIKFFSLLLLTWMQGRARYNLKHLYSYSKFSLYLHVKYFLKIRAQPILKERMEKMRIKWKWFRYWFCEVINCIRNRV